MVAQQLESETRRALDWEWRVALLTILGGFAVAIAVILFIYFRTPSPQAVETARRAQLTSLMKSQALVCSQAMAAAKNFGIVPSYASPASLLPSETQVRGRYLCAAATNIGHYNIAVDLYCRELKNPRCVQLFSVTQQDGTILYKRQS
ncbi:MAG: hypothetical protein JO056_13705 [Alphaproteobacteria bacterium]|nr:hypothetical protein [Alphaproteobacteria bacterium]